MKWLLGVLLGCLPLFICASGQNKNVSSSAQLAGFSGSWTVIKSSIPSFQAGEWEVTVAEQEIRIKKTGGQGKQPVVREIALFVDGRRETNPHFRLDGTQTEIRSTTHLQRGKIIRKYKPQEPQTLLPYPVSDLLHVLEISESYYLINNGMQLKVDVVHKTSARNNHNKHPRDYTLVLTKKT